MQEILEEILQIARKHKMRRMRAIAILLVLSLVVSMDVFWVLRQPGLTLAGDADCKITEHTHDDRCQSGETPCTLEEHVHTLDCYADKTADAETQLDWQEQFADYPHTGNLREDLVGIAKTQVGYTESTENFQVDENGIRHGYTRYGAWYGVPYNDWSVMFVSFCLHYAGADPEEFPPNIGASSMAILWKNRGKYIDTGQYTPVSGDLVFFTDDTVGIVTEVLGATFCVIRGDVEDAVCSSVMSLADETIRGWGLINGPPPEEEQPPDPETEVEIPDISDGPVFIIIEGNADPPPMRRFSLRRSVAITELLPYLEANNGSYFFTLLNYQNEELPKDDQGHYIVQAGTGYKLTITFTSPEGFPPGTYQYQVPNGLMVDGGKGEFVLQDETNVGSWEVTDTGLITLVFNEHMNSRTEITISASLGIHFPEQDNPIDFDGKISVTVKPPPQQNNPTILEKWTNPAANTDKLIWHVNIFGQADSQIPGSILTDQILLPDWYKPHTYTQSDMDAGLTFGVEDGNGGWHSWTVTVDDPHLVWDESSWSYKIPQSVVCDTCGELVLGNNGWKYYITYSSTPTPLNTPGTFPYANKVTVDNQTAWGWNEFTHGQVDAQVIKNGTFVSDATGGGFLWEIQTVIPGRVEGQRAEYAWAISDEMRLLNEYDASIGVLPNDINLAAVTAIYNGEVITIPRIQDATDQDMFAWDNAWTSEGVPATRTLNLLCRCQCTPETCHWQNCGEYWYKDDTGQTVGTREFCQCWTEPQNMTFTFVYKTTDISMIEAYGALGYKVYNQVQLFYLDDAGKSVPVDKDDAAVAIPNMLGKELTHDFDGYTAHYKITVNEAKLTLTDGTPLTIRDVMTKTLAYISGSLVITAEDGAGNIVELKLGDDYTVSYDGTGNKTDANGKEVHVLEIVILRPQPVTYILDYDTTLIVPNVVTEGIKYSNSVTITLWGEDIHDAATEKVYADINIASKSYQVDVYKTAARTGQPLSGAMFGLYNEHGGLITTAVTDANGKLVFKTNIVEGIILREHVLYYIQELRAPPGYQLDSTKFWICFCNETGESCSVYKEILTGISAIRIPFEQVGNIQITNEIQSYDLPTTGGPGIYPLILVSVSFIITPLVYMSVRRRKRERRGVG